MTRPQGMSLVNETYTREGDEVAALRAENERLKDRLEMAEEGLTAAYLSGKHDAMKGDEVAALKTENARLRKLDAEYGRVEAAIILADPNFDGNSKHKSCADRLIASVERLALKGGDA